MDRLTEGRVGEWMFSFPLVVISVLISWGSVGGREVEGAGSERNRKDKADDEQRRISLQASARARRGSL